MSFESLGLSTVVLKGVGAVGYTEPTPIQKEAIPPILAGKDVTGCAQTGTGKTAAFVLPLLHRLTGGRGLRALVLVPTRELAVQVELAIRGYGRFTGLRSTTVYGGVSLVPQVQRLRAHPDFVVATPGRLLDHLNRGNLRLDRIETVVLDEADRMLDMGFARDLDAILAKTPRTRQTLLFSATLPAEIVALSRDNLRNPVKIEIGRRSAPAAGVTHSVYCIEQSQKVGLLKHLLHEKNGSPVLIFTRTKHRADRLGKQLSHQGHTVGLLHGDRSQPQREAALEGFRRGQLRLLVATNVAARGLDVDGIGQVINFDVPTQPEEYIHRIGRTGRAQAVGEAVTLVAPEEEAQLRQIERHIRMTLPRLHHNGR